MSSKLKSLLKLALSSKTISLNKIKNKSKIHLQIDLKEPGILMRGWFK